MGSNNEIKRLKGTIEDEDCLERRKVDDINDTIDISEVDNKTYQCPLNCSQIFFEKVDFENHIESVHNKDEDESVDKDNIDKNVDKETITTKSVTTKTSGSIRNNVACPICDLPFMSEEIMKSHKTAVHQKVKKYQATPLATTSKTLIVSHKTRKLIFQKKEI